VVWVSPLGFLLCVLVFIVIPFLLFLVLFLGGIDLVNTVSQLVR
jgi:hypothetical protein